MARTTSTLTIDIILIASPPDQRRSLANTSALLSTMYARSDATLTPRRRVAAIQLRLTFGSTLRKRRDDFGRRDLTREQVRCSLYRFRSGRRTSLDGSVRLWRERLLRSLHFARGVETSLDERADTCARW